MTADLEITREKTRKEKDTIVGLGHQGQMEEIMGQFEYVDDYPIQVRFKHPNAETEAIA